MTQPEAEATLGWSRASIIRHEARADEPVPRYIALACAAFDAGLEPR